MMQDAYTVEFSDLAQIADVWGARITPKWLSKKMEQGLLPKECHSPGLGQGAGRELSRYSEAVRYQLPILLAAIQTHGKNLNAVGWYIWRRGGNVHSKYWRGEIEARMESIKRVREFLRSESNFAKLVRFLISKRRLHPFLGRTRRRLKDEFPEFLDKIFSLIKGNYEPVSSLSHDEREALIDYRQIGSALSLPVRNASTNIDVYAFEMELVAIQEFMKMNLRNWLSTVSATEITEGRNELFAFVDALIEFGLLAPKYTKSTLVIWIFEFISRSVRAESALLLGWLWLRRREDARRKMIELTILLRQKIPMLQLQNFLATISEVPSSATS